mmetsp:Transcript_10327/g.23910  ORF Transcript_10327/g.23910 Transcript_10327/m.23910 type:complete len:213 (+) Transcript_10327:112-750(+)
MRAGACCLCIIGWAINEEVIIADNVIVAHVGALISIVGIGAVATVSEVALGDLQAHVDAARVGDTPGRLLPAAQRVLAALLASLAGADIVVFLGHLPHRGSLVLVLAVVGAVFIVEAADDGLELLVVVAHLGVHTVVLAHGAAAAERDNTDLDGLLLLVVPLEERAAAVATARVLAVDVEAGTNHSVVDGRSIGFGAALFRDDGDIDLFEDA